MTFHGCRAPLARPAGRCRPFTSPTLCAVIDPRTTGTRHLRHLARHTRALAQDVRGSLRWGSAAPRVAERVWIDPRRCTTYRYGLPRSRSGTVQGGSWDQPQISLSESQNFQACELHWIEGVPWADTGIFAYLHALIARKGSADGCTTHAELVERYEQLDRVFATVQSEGRLRTRAELDPAGFRESGGVYVHFDRTGTPVFGGGGHHRLAMARILELPVMPVQVGVVHRDGLDTWRSRLPDPVPVG